VDPVAQAQLGQDVADVRLDRGVADDQLAGRTSPATPGDEVIATSPITVAVTGGTGAYAGARGTLTSKAGADTLTLQ
jgi:hypothetical protein